MQPPPLLSDRPLTRLPRDGGREPAARPVAVEAPVQVLYGGVPFAVMMATPGDLEDFAYGFSLTEGVVGAAAEIRSVHIGQEAGGTTIDVAIAPDRMHATLARRRTLSGRTGCGVCGIDDLASVLRAEPGASGPRERDKVSLASIRLALATLPGLQTLGRETGATHAAAWADPDGTVTLLREDVGRHNALDKLIGAALRAGVDPWLGFAVVTSRCSFEMVEKTASFGAGCLVAISGPTSLAIERAAALGVALVAFARGDSVSVFHGAERIKA